MPKKWIHKYPKKHNRQIEADIKFIDLLWLDKWRNKFAKDLTRKELYNQLIQSGIELLEMKYSGMFPNRTEVFSEYIQLISKE